MVTEALVQFGVTDLTTLEIEPEAAERLRRRYRTRVRVEVGDAADMPFSNASFAFVLCCTMLHHVPSRESQDRVLVESRRVLRRGGVLAGSDSRASLSFRLFHIFDIHNPVDPDGFPERLIAAGFHDVSVDQVKDRFRFRAVAPG